LGYYIKSSDHRNNYMYMLIKNGYLSTFLNPSLINVYHKEQFSILNKIN